MSPTPARSITSSAATARAAAGGSLPVALGDWQLVRLAAIGPVCRVYQARPANRGGVAAACYAVKLLDPCYEKQPEALTQIRREALLGRKVPHPHLVSILASHVTEPPYYVVMPWLQGATLADRLAAGWQPELPVALWIARQTAEALGALHKGGWMHTDVKPSNLFLSSDGHATLLDLGFARHRDETVVATDRYVLGTVRYMAPEMLTSALRPDIRSDLYSLGVTLYEMLAGRPPFDAEDIAELATQHLRDEPADIRSLAIDVPLEVARLVHTLLAKEPLRRPQSPRELIDRLTRLEIACFAQRLVDVDCLRGDDEDSPEAGLWDDAVEGIATTAAARGDS